MKLSEEDLQTIRGGQKEPAESGQKNKESMRKALAKTMLQREYSKAQQIGQRLWKTPPRASSSTTDDNPCAQIADLGAKHIEARQERTNTNLPCRGKRASRANPAGNTSEQNQQPHTRHGALGHLRAERSAKYRAAASSRGIRSQNENGKTRRYRAHQPEKKAPTPTLFMVSQVRGKAA